MGSKQEVEELSVSFFKIGPVPFQGGGDDLHTQRTDIDEGAILTGDSESHPALSCSRRGASFSCLSGAAIGANATLPNTEMGNGILSNDILPGIDSPRSFRPVAKSSSFSTIEALMSSPPDPTALPEHVAMSSSSAASVHVEMEGPLASPDAQTAGGAAGEDRIQVVCSESGGWLFCAIYDGFNGRDAADFLAATLYNKISRNLTHLVEQCHHHEGQQGPDHGSARSVDGIHGQERDGYHLHHGQYHEERTQRTDEPSRSYYHHGHHQYLKFLHAEYPISQKGVLRALKKALMESEAAFMEIVQQEMEEKPYLAMVGSCVLVVLLYGGYLYTMSLGDSRAVLATKEEQEGEAPVVADAEHERQGGEGEAAGEDSLRCVQLTEDHVAAARSERERLLAEHPDDPTPIVNDRVKGVISVTRAFGVGYLKKGDWNNKLMWMRVADLRSPPYISAKPHLATHKLSNGDEFVVMASDGLFDFFTNEEVIYLLHEFFCLNPPTADPARFLLDQLLMRVAKSSGVTVEHLRSLEIGRRRFYHDDVTIIVITLGSRHYTSSASKTP
ncbi:hypothetical protein KP509_09G081500 [Ceratopteris richardii]|uniref:protein-serine/threonine phosphatase n=1 Tax=Ceratopteris richardii TaxID=49495 RepID=A0A8T2UC70_CERRI|nr:hypothetical protein KP509_09G081500 [Ceratopteris richardii]